MDLIGVVFYNKKKIDTAENRIFSLMITTKLNLNMKEYTKTDPNEMDYDDAIRRDKRTLCIFFGVSHLIVSFISSPLESLS